VPPPPEPETTDRPVLVGVGASAGGYLPLRELLASLPEDLPAAVLVVMHLRSARPSTLADQLRRVSALPVETAEDGTALRPGHVYVAPPDRHLEVRDGRVVVHRGPTENGHRPAVDVMFRSLSRVGGSRSVAVVLSGALDDGSAGAVAVADAGGTVIVQDPDDAVVGSMPQHALDAVPHALCIATSDLASAIDEQVGHAVGRGPSRVGDPLPPTPEPSSFACPECGGILGPEEDERLQSFRCQVGHRWGAAGLRTVQVDALENALWSALRIIDDQIRLDQGLLDRAQGAGRAAMVTRLTERLAERDAAARLLRDAMAQLVGSDDVTPV
jgi:two-component system, chemotaxis family, protein-glutamate methylesterase/glutaminase